MDHEPQTEAELRAEIKKLREEVAEYHAQREYLERLHKIDYLTGLYNRRAFDHELELLLGMISGERVEHRAHAAELKCIALLFIDLDHFKNINDVYGHLFGDEVLKKVSSLFKQLTREHDFPARVGGEEFAILLPDVGVESAVLIAEKYRKAVESLTFDELGVQNFSITASFGVATSENSLSPKELYGCADAAVYAAKEGGRNKVVLYTNDLKSA